MTKVRRGYTPAHRCSLPLIALIGLTTVVDPCLSQVRAEAEPPSRERTMVAAQRVWDWDNFWDPTELSRLGYKRGKVIQVFTSASDEAAGFCSPELAVCYGFRMMESALLPIGFWRLPGGSLGERPAIAFLEEHLLSSTRNLPTVPPTRSEGTKRSFDPNSFSRLPQRPAGSVNFVRSSLEY